MRQERRQDARQSPESMDRKRALSLQDVPYHKVGSRGPRAPVSVGSPAKKQRSSSPAKEQGRPRTSNAARQDWATRFPTEYDKVCKHIDQHCTTYPAEKWTKLDSSVKTNIRRAVIEEIRAILPKEWLNRPAKS